MSADPTRDPSTFLGLQTTDDPLRWRLPVKLAICGATGYLHGGCALAAAVTVLESATGRPVVWIASQYLSRVKPGDMVDFTVELRAVGRSITQAALSATKDGRVVFHSTASLGGRDSGVDGAWFPAPDVPPPDECALRATDTQEPGTFTHTADIRIARAALGERTTVYWARLPGRLATTRAGVAMIGDLLPSAMRITASTEMKGSSLDNTLRFATTDDTEWLLLELETTAFGHGVGHGVARAFSANGVYLGTASQSFAINKVLDPLTSPLR